MGSVSTTTSLVHGTPHGDEFCPVTNTTADSSRQSHTRKADDLSSDLDPLLEAQRKWRGLLTGSSLEPSHITRSLALTTSNLRTNEPWGDRLSPKQDHITRIYSINVNGITVDGRGGTFDDICRDMKMIQADVLCLQEHNLDTTQAQVRSTLYDTASRHWQRQRLMFSTTPITVIDRKSVV